MSVCLSRLSSHFYNNDLSTHCYLDHIVAAITFDTNFAFDNIVVFVIPLVALLTSSPVMWREVHLSNESSPYYKEHNFTILFLFLHVH
jgi:hypothetical protein